MSRDKRPANLTNIASMVGVKLGQNAPATGHAPGQKDQKACLTLTVFDLQV